MPSSPPNVTLDDRSHTYRVGNLVVPSVTGILDGVGIRPDYPIPAGAKERGSAVHAACHYLDEGTLDWDSVHDAMLGYVEAWQRWKSEAGLEIIEMERPRSSVRGFAGSPDRVGYAYKDHTRISVVDLKTGPVLPWVGIQLAGYAILVDEAHPRHLPPRRLAVELRPDGTFSVREFASHEDKSVFLSALAIHHWKGAQGVRGG